MGRRPPWKVLLGLFLAVLLAHMLLLRALPFARVWLEPARKDTSAGTRLSFVIRPLPAAPADAPTEDVAQAPAARVRQPAPAARAKAVPTHRSPVQASAPPPPQDDPDLAAQNSENSSEESNTDAAIMLVSDKNVASHRGARERAAAGTHGATLPTMPAVQVPPSRHLFYDVSGEIKHFPYAAQAQLLWRNEGASYSARLAINALFLLSRVQTSVGQLTAQGLAPDRFGDKVRSEVAAHFERDKGLISFSANSPSIPLQPMAQDRLSVLLQLSALLAGAPAHYPPGSVISLQTVGPRSADEWRFVVQAPETLALPAGPHRTVRLQREALKDYDLGVDVWLASDLAWLPVQLRLTQSNGDFVQLQLKSAEKP